MLSHVVFENLNVCMNEYVCYCQYDEYGYSE